MAHAEKCPVCGGIGVRIVPSPVVEGKLIISYVDTTINCHGCGGLGWVTVQDEQAYYATPYYDSGETAGGFSVPIDRGISTG